MIKCILVIMRIKRRRRKKNDSSDEFKSNIVEVGECDIIISDLL
jgi:hypothetical protein